MDAHSKGYCSCPVCVCVCVCVCVYVCVSFLLRIYRYDNAEKQLGLLGIQWNLRIKDKLVHGHLSTIRRLSFMGVFVKKAFNSVLYR